ncbi:MAG: OmpA family protein [Bacteroidota bacterium]
MPRLLLAACAALLLAGCVNPELLAERDAEIGQLQSDLDLAYAEIERLRGENERLRDAPPVTVVQPRPARRGERGETVAILPTDIYFESGSAQLTPEGVSRLIEVVDRLKTEYAGREVRIEGYTDAQPIAEPLKERYPSNWELSAARAAMVARHLQWTHEMNPSQMEVVGLGQYHPLTTNETEEGRQENRRVRIAVMGG